MASDEYVYVIDTSSWLLIEGHPSANRILDALSKLLEDGRLKAPPEVFAELETVDAVTAWVRINKKSILVNRNSDIEYLLRVGQVTAKFPGMVGVRGRREKADPYIVALASLGSPKPDIWAVVCDETTAKRPNRKVPTACKAFGVECLGIFDMLRREFPDDVW